MNQEAECKFKIATRLNTTDLQPTCSLGLLGCIRSMDQSYVAAIDGHELRNRTAALPQPRGGRMWQDVDYAR